MSKKSKKKKHIYTYEERTAAKSAVIDQAKRFNFRLAFTMLGIFVLLAGIYALCIHQEAKIWAKIFLPAERNGMTQLTSMYMIQKTGNKCVYLIVFSTMKMAVTHAE